MDRQAKIDQVMKQFADAWQEGNTDPRPFLEMVSEYEREDLGRQIDLFLMTAPPKKWDRDSFMASPAARITERVLEATRCPAGAWPEVIPALMLENQLEREEVAAELAGELGAETPEEVEQVEDYFHRMNWGTLEASGVSDRVLEVLGRILRTSGENLREAGRALGKKFPTGEGDDVVYARTPSDPELTIEYDVASRAEEGRGSERIDRLFTGGPSAGAGD